MRSSRSGRGWAQIYWCWWWFCQYVSANGSCADAGSGDIVWWGRKSVVRNLWRIIIRSSWIVWTGFELFDESWSGANSSGYRGIAWQDSPLRHTCNVLWCENVFLRQTLSEWMKEWISPLWKLWYCARSSITHYYTSKRYPIHTYISYMFYPFGSFVFPRNSI